MQNYLRSKLGNNFNIENLGYISFLIGVFLLASAVGISILFFLISVVISFSKSKGYFKDKWNYPFILSSIYMSISTIMHFINSRSNSLNIIDPKLSLIGLTNWIPLFLCFWAFQKYLNNQRKRILTGKILICGSIPVIFSGLLQLMNINGPFELFNGLIVWFQKPISELGSVSGLFNNQNYAGIWMAMTWPFCLFELKKNSRNITSKFIIILISICFACFIFMTDSRNAILGFLISTPIVLGSSSLIWYLPTLIIGLSILAIAVIPIFPESFQIFMKSFVPSRLYTLFPEIGLEYVRSYPRVNKWLAALNFIASKPFFGWGAASFPIIYRIKSGEWFGHSHSLPLELAVSYGIIPTIAIFSTYIFILYLAFIKIFRSPKIKINEHTLSFHRALFASFLIFLLSHLVDIQYFDARISLYSWILLAGLKSLIEEKNIKSQDDVLFK